MHGRGAAREAEIPVGGGRGEPGDGDGGGDERAQRRDAGERAECEYGECGDAGGGAGAAGEEYVGYLGKVLGGCFGWGVLGVDYWDASCFLYCCVINGRVRLSLYPSRFLESQVWRFGIRDYLMGGKWGAERGGWANWMEMIKLQNEFMGFVNE